MKYASCYLNIPVISAGQRPGHKVQHCVQYCRNICHSMWLHAAGFSLLNKILQNLLLLLLLASVCVEEQWNATPIDDQSVVEL